MANLINNVAAVPVPSGSQNQRKGQNRETSNRKKLKLQAENVWKVTALITASNEYWV